VFVIYGLHAHLDATCVYWMGREVFMLVSLLFIHVSSLRANKMTSVNENYFKFEVGVVIRFMQAE
jgi:hypothetical protein